MRLFLLNFLLLASVAMALSNGRQKRHLSYLKNLISTAVLRKNQINIQPTSVVQKEPKYKLFRLPGHDDVMIKVSPKKPVVEEIVYPPVNLNAFGSVVGTKSPDDTLVAVKDVDNLLSTGILYGGHNNLIKESVVPMFPTLNPVNYITEEKVKTAPVIETRSPVITEVIKPLEEKVELKVPIEPKYLYEQIENNEPVMTFKAHYNPEIEVMESIKMKTELPMCIKKRIDEAIMLGADPYRLTPVQEVYQYQTPPVVDISYPGVETRSYVPHYIHGDQLPGFGNADDYRLSPQRLRTLKGSHVHNIPRPVKTKAINPRPISLYSNQAPHLDEVNISASKANVNSPTTVVHAITNLGDKVNVSQTLGPIPPQYVAHISNKGLPVVTKEKKVEETKAPNIMPTKDNISNGKIPSYVYKYQSNPNTGKVGQGGNVLRTNVQINNYVTAPNVNSGTAKTDTTQVKDGVFTNKVTTNPQSVTKYVVVPSSNAPKENALKENKPTSFKSNPIVVPDVKTYSYQQKNVDGSSLNVKGGKNGVSVVRENSFKGRGDIPDQ